MTDNAYIARPIGVPGISTPGGRALLLDGAVILCAVALMAGFILAAGVTNVALRDYPDDAFFYNIVARNIVSGLGSTSDGIAQSNGYHPLWMAVMAGLCSMFDDVLLPEAILQTAILAATLLLLYSYLARYTGRLAALLICILASFEQTYTRVLCSGMESPLAFLSLLLVLCSIQGKTRSQIAGRRLAVLAVSLALLFFSRLDGGLMWAAFAGVCVMNGASDPGNAFARARFLAKVLWLPALLAVAYLIGNCVFFSSAVPISGRIKAVSFDLVKEMGLAAYLGAAAAKLYRLYTFDAVETMIGMASSGGAILKAVYAATLAIALFFAIRALLRANRNDLSLRALAAYVAIHTAYYLFLQTDTYSLGWAKGPELLLMSLALAYAVFRAGLFFRPLRAQRLAAGAAIALALAAACGYHHRRNLRPAVVGDFLVSREDFFLAIEYVKAHVPADAVVASVNIGFLGYFARRKVMSVDGLLNSAQYYRDYRKRGKEIAYLREHGVRHIVNRVPKDSDAVADLCGRFQGLKESMVKVAAEFSKGTGVPFVKNKYVVYEIAGQT